jgi:hypothetical protein
MDRADVGCRRGQCVGGEATMSMYELICNDNIKAMLSMQPDSVDLTITSPPYNLEDNQWDMGGGNRKKRQGIEYKAHKDNMNQADYEAWQVSGDKEVTIGEDTSYGEYLHDVFKDPCFFHHHNSTHRKIRHKKLTELFTNSFL